jgi:outer membrane receptor protein involved in Fe transport
LVNVGQAATFAPSNVSTFTPANTGNSNFFTGSYIADLRGLNPYFGSRTLVLLDGQRVVNSNQGDSFDLNLVPQVLVSRIDTVTGGASAAYGSGAIAGVVNVILDNKLEGGKLTGDFYQTSQSDGRDRHFGAAYGHGLFDNRVHLLIGGEYENSDAVGCEFARSWCATNTGSYELGSTPPSSGSADILGYGSDVRSNFNSGTGVLYNLSNFGGYHGAPGPVNVTPDGTATQPYLTGLPQLSFADSVQGGQGVPIYQYANLQAPVNRGNGMFAVTAQVTENINFKANVLLAREETTNYNGGSNVLADYLSPQNAYGCPGTAGTGGAIGSTCINAGSPTLAAALNQQQFFPGADGAYLNKDWTSQLNSYTRFHTDVTRVTFGFDGKFGQSSWSWDANYNYGLTHHDQLVNEPGSLYRILMALDTVNTPNGPECRVTADGFAAAAAANPFAGYGGANAALANGCVPLDPFGNQPLSAAAVNYSFGSLDEQLRNIQTDVTLNASGNYFSGVGAGPFSAAIGYEWRQERGDNIDQPGQPSYLADDYEIQYGSSFGGVMTVNEGYIETNLPIIKDKPGAHLLEFDLAGRESQYQNSALYGVDVCTTPGTNGCPLSNAPPGTTFTHEFFTWKASGIFEPVEGVRFRASQSRDERAPNFRELYYNQVIGAGGLFGQCGPFGTTVDPCTWNLLGNPNLKPESSDTTTVGIVLTPRDFVPGFQFSADWFHIKVNNAIEQANPTLLFDNCRLYAQCAGITFNNNAVTAAGAPCPGGLQGQPAYAAGCYNLQEIAPTSYNGAFYEVRGVDFSLNYLMDLGEIGTVNTRLLTTWMDQQDFQSYPGGPVLSILGQTGTGNGFLNDYTPSARWRGSLLITWAKGPLSITPNMNFVSHGVMDYLGVTPADGKLYTETLNGTLPANLQAYGFHPMPYNYVPSYFLFGLNATYSFANGAMEALKGLQVFVQVNNLFNKTPPFTGGESEFGPANVYGGTNPIFFDTLGLAYRVGFRLTF